MFGHKSRLKSVLVLLSSCFAFLPKLSLLKNLQNQHMTLLKLDYQI